MYTNERGMPRIDTSVINSRSRWAGTVVKVPNLILDPLRECQVAECIVKESPEDVESWRKTQEKLAETDEAIRSYNLMNSHVAGKKKQIKDPETFKSKSNVVKRSKR